MHDDAHDANVQAGAHMPRLVATTSDEQPTTGPSERGPSRLHLALHPSRELALVVSGSALLLTLAAPVAAYAADACGARTSGGPWYTPIFTGLTSLSALLVGGLIAARQPRNVYGWLWLVLGTGAGVLQAWGSTVACLALEPVARNPVLGAIALYAAALGWIAAITMVVLTMLLFPTGRPPGRRWGWLLRLTLVAATTAALLAWALPSEGVAPVAAPYEASGAAANVAYFLGFGAVALILILGLPGAVLSLLFRYRSATGLERAQLRWLAFAAAANLTFFALDTSELHRPWIPEETMSNLSNVLLAAIPLAVAVAILRYRLYDIDVIIRKTLVYSGVTALLSLVYTGTVILLQTLVGSLASEQSPLVIVVSTLLVAALFAPIRTRVQTVVDRRFFRQKYNAVQVLEQFALRARDEVELTALAAELTRVVEQTMQPVTVGVWLRETYPRRGKA